MEIIRKEKTCKERIRREKTTRNEYERRRQQGTKSLG